MPELGSVDAGPTGEALILSSATESEDFRSDEGLRFFPPGSRVTTLRDPDVSSGSLYRSLEPRCPGLNVTRRRLERQSPAEVDEESSSTPASWIAAPAPSLEPDASPAKTKTRTPSPVTNKPGIRILLEKPRSSSVIESSSRTAKQEERARETLSFLENRQTGVRNELVIGHDPTQNLSEEPISCAQVDKADV